MNLEKVKVMITMTCPVPDGNIPISKRPARDDLKELLIACGLEFFLEKQLEEIRTELDPESTGTVPIDKLAEWICQ
jgi:hypothetical protein